jgi:thiol:disulfide interchange protein DsbD
MDTETLSNPKVEAALQHFTLLRADVTQNLPGHQALLKRFGLFGPPGMIVLANGHELDRVIGFEDPDRFLGRLTTSLTRTSQASL